MPSKLGRLIRQKRTKMGLGLRQFAREIGKSPSFVVMLEKDSQLPHASEDTLRRIAEVLELEPDMVITVAGKVPEDLKPSTELEIALYRRVKQMTKEQKERLHKRLSKEGK